MKIIGLTGGIGTGKSTAAAYFIDRGVLHIDADKIGAEITENGSVVLNVLDDVFGPEGEMGEVGHNILNDDGSLNRKALASIVFADGRKTKKLNEIMFDRIISEIKTRIDNIKNNSINGDEIVLIDAPLLFEAGADRLCDDIILITADKDVRIGRVCLRDGMDKSEVQARIDKQLNDDYKIAKSDYVVDNSEGIEEFYKKLNKIYKKVVDN